MPFGVFDIALAALAALLGGLAGRQLALRRWLALPLAAAIGALAGLTTALLLGGYFGSVFVGLLVLAIFVFISDGPFHVFRRRTRWTRWRSWSAWIGRC